MRRAGLTLGGVLVAFALVGAAGASSAGRSPTAPIAVVRVSGGPNGVEDVFVHDMQTGVTTRVSVDSNGNDGDRASGRPSISGDGRYVAFDSLATNLVAGDTNSLRDVFVHDMQTGATTRVSVDPAGTQATGGASQESSLDDDGLSVAFSSSATNLVANDTNGSIDIFVHDMQSGATTRMNL